MMLYGIFVGIDNYQDASISKLRFAVEDVKELHALFSKNISEDECEFFLLSNEAATKKNILQLIGENLASKVKPTDYVVIYFAGHGCPEINNLGEVRSERYLIVYDTFKDHLFSTGINLETEIVSLVERLASRLVVIFIDSCFSGAAGGRTFEGKKYQFAREKLRAPISLKSLSLGEGRVMMGACGDNEVALEAEELGHGVFSFYVIQGIQNLSYSTHSVSLGRLYDDVAENVQKYTKGRQTPVLNGRSSFAKIPGLSI